MPDPDTLPDALLQPVILAGGAGTRLWPLSRRQRPKAFLTLDGEQSLLQRTLERLRGLPCRPARVVCQEEHRFLAAEQLRCSGNPVASILLEPEGRGTAPATALAALTAAQGMDDDPLLLVLPADHAMANLPAFHAAVRRAAVLAAQGWLVSFAVAPTRAETGYGYLQRGAPLAGGWRVRRFVEKPDATTAAAYLAAGYDWNSGMFLFRASSYLRELQHGCPRIAAACRAACAATQRDLDFLRVERAAYEQCPAQAIDTAVMERTEHAAAVALDAGWDDLGTWHALATRPPLDAAGNHVHGDVLLDRVQRSLVHAESRLVAAVGVHDLAIVETADAVLVAARDDADGVRDIVRRLGEAGRAEQLRHRQVHRPWGHYVLIDSGSHYQVKHIVVNPGASLSLQKHRWRAEHWVVVHGVAQVVRGRRRFSLRENQSTYIPAGTVHALANAGAEPLAVIEVQSGAYLGEDDIVRLKDRYGRA